MHKRVAINAASALVIATLLAAAYMGLASTALAYQQSNGVDVIFDAPQHVGAPGFKASCNALEGLQTAAASNGNGRHGTWTVRPFGECAPR